MSIPRTTHTWLQPLYNALEGKKARPLQLGSPTGALGLYGASGILRPTGLGAITASTGLSGYDTKSNGGTGTQFYSLQDLVLILKLRGDITT